MQEHFLSDGENQEILNMIKIAKALNKHGNITVTIAIVNGQKKIGYNMNSEVKEYANN